MSTPAFTPGPWLVHATNRVVVRALDAFAPVTVENGKVVGDDEDMPVSICLLRDPDDGLSEDETLANGFLIAAAPELYGALVAAAKRFRDYEEQHRIKAEEWSGFSQTERDKRVEKAEANRQAAEQCEAALAKARGEQ